MGRELPVAGIVLAGGRSTRMGTDKASLDWDGTPLVVHMLGIVGEVVDGPVVVAAAPGQGLPVLPVGVEVVRDPSAGEGPLRGIHTGLAALAGRAEVAFVTSCDAPGLRPAVAQLLLASLGDREGALALIGGRPVPLPSAWRVVAVDAVADALAAGERSVRRFAATRHVATVAEAELRLVDPALETFAPLNTPEQLSAARLRVVE